MVIGAGAQSEKDPLGAERSIKLPSGRPGDLVTSIIEEGPNP
jgi:hypothetical protein